MNILYVVNSGNPGGVEQHILDLSEGLVKKEHTVFICCKEGVISEWYRKAGATVLIDTIGFDIDPFYIIRLAKFIKSNKIDVVHTHELKAGINGVLAAKLAGVKTIITHIHTPMSEWRAESIFKKVIFKIESIFYSQFVNFFANYEIALTRSRKEIKQIEGIYPSKLKIIPNAIHCELFDTSEPQKSKDKFEIMQRYNIPQNALIIGNIGRLSVEKGLHFLIEAFAQAKDSYSSDRPLFLLLAGGGSLQDKLVAKSIELAISDNVVITGVFDQNDKAKFYNSLDIFVFPSLAEGFGIVFLEGMSSGLPTICSDLPVLKEVGSNEVMYFESGNSADLAEKLANLIKLPAEERLTLGKNLKKHVQQSYSMPKFIENYISLYQKGSPHI